MQEHLDNNVSQDQEIVNRLNHLVSRNFIRVAISHAEVVSDFRLKYKNGLPFVTFDCITRYGKRSNELLVVEDQDIAIERKNDWLPIKQGVPREIERLIDEVCSINAKSLGIKRKIKLSCSFYNLDSSIDIL